MALLKIEEYAFNSMVLTRFVLEVVQIRLLI